MPSTFVNRIFVKGEPRLFFDIPMANDNLMVHIQNLLACGYLATDKLYIPASSIAHMSVTEFIDGRPNVVPLKPVP